MIKQITGVLSACAIALTLGAPVAHAGKDNDTLVFATKLELAHVDAYFNTSRIGIILARHVWDNLLYRDPNTFTYKPALATAYRWIDNVTLEFDLREGVTFHNGEPFDADDVVYTLNFVSNPDSNVKAQRNVNWIKNVEKISSHKVRVNLKKPFPAALDFVSGALPIYPNEYYAEVGPKGMNTQPIGTGPYKVTKVIQGESIYFDRNPDYYKASPKGQPAIAKLVMRVIPDDNAAVAELLTGGVDWLWKVPRDQGEALSPNPALTVTGGETMRIGYLQMDAAGRAGDHPLKDVRVRKAIAHAINRESIIKNLLPTGSRLVHAACYPKQVGCTDDVVKYEYDPAKSKKLLAEAGFADGFEIKLDAYRNRDLVEAMIGDLRAVGIKAKLNYNKYAATRDAVRAGKSAFNYMTWGSYSINDISAITSNFFKLGGDDTARDEEVAKWLEEGDTRVDPAVRKAAYAKALNKISAEAYWLPTYTYAYLYAYTKDLEFHPAADEVPRFFTAKWK